MLDEEFVPFEIAVKLKEILGFDERCFGYYMRYPSGCDKVSVRIGITNSKLFSESQNSFKLQKRGYEKIAAPLNQQVVAWLKKEHGYVLEVAYQTCEEPYHYWRRYDVGEKTSFDASVIFKSKDYNETLHHGIHSTIQLISQKLRFIETNKQII